MNARAWLYPPRLSSLIHASTVQSLVVFSSAACGASAYAPAPLSARLLSGPIAKFAVKLAPLGPTTTSCSCAPPSDHDTKVPLPCGEGALMVWVEPAIVVRVKGAVAVSPS